MRLDIFNIDFLSRFIQEQISQSFSFLMSLDVHDNFIINHRCIHHRLCNQTSSYAAWNHSIFPLYSMMILNQPHRLITFNFGEITPRFGAFKNIVRKFESIFESSNSFTLSSNEKTLQIHKYWYRHNCYCREDCGRLWCIATNAKLCISTLTVSYTTSNGIWQQRLQDNKTWCWLVWHDQLSGWQRVWYAFC